ncbi:MAG: hypothetical protein AAFR37_17970, partial [Cyanobacteria bacterium J06628_3]
LEEINPAVIEGMFACDLNYLHKFYRQINEVEDDLEEDVNNTKEINQLEANIPSITAGFISSNAPNLVITRARIITVA